jgi:glycosyltransferase involved in cell wall biosynthesis
VSEPIASVIVPVRDGGGHVARLLAALETQTIAPGRFEVVIGDDGSRDGALEGVEAGRPWLRIVAGPPRNSYVARNRAVGASRAPVLAFCDVDCGPEPGWLQAGLTALEGAEVVAGCVRFVVPERASVWTLLEAEASIDQRYLTRLRAIATANAFVRRELFDRMGGFDERLPSGGDWEFSRRCAEAGATFAYAHEAVVTHPGDGRAYLHKLWFRSRWAATRKALAGERPDLLAAVLPSVRLMQRRSRGGRAFTIDRQRLAEQGIETLRGRELDLLAAAVRYTVLPAIVWGARVVGWTDGLRRRALAGGRGYDPPADSRGGR